MNVVTSTAQAMGAIFNCDYFQWSKCSCGIGRTEIWNDPARNIHQKLIMVWELVDVNRRPPHPGPPPGDLDELRKAIR